jgi:hypothetical protein
VLPEEVAMQVIDIAPFLEQRQAAAADVQLLQMEVCNLAGRVDVVIQSISRELSATVSLIKRLPRDDRREKLQADCAHLGLLLVQVESMGRAALAGTVHTE